MASEGKTSYTKIGFIVVAGIVAVAGSLFYFGGVRGSGDLVYAETYFDRSVSGLSVGSAVNFRGVKIGEVKEISFVGNKYNVRGDDNLRVYIKMGFPRSRLTAYDDEGVGADEALGYMVESVGIRATVSASGVTGLSRIELDAAPDRDPAELDPKVRLHPAEAVVHRQLLRLRHPGDGPDQPHGHRRRLEQRERVGRVACAPLGRREVHARGEPLRRRADHW